MKSNLDPIAQMTDCSLIEDLREALLTRNKSDAQKLRCHAEIESRLRQRKLALITEQNNCEALRVRIDALLLEIAAHHRAAKGDVVANAMRQIRRMAEAIMEQVEGAGVR